MLIVSKFRDYYDGLARQGVDKTLVYHRETKDSDQFVDLPERTCSLDEDHVLRSGKVCRLSGKRHTIIFCGKPYIFWRGEVSFQRETGFIVEQIFFRDTRKELFDAMRKLYGLEEKKRRLYSWRRHLNKDDRVSYKEAVENTNWEAIHFATKCPVLTLRGADSAETKQLPARNYSHQTRWFRVVENPVLKDIGFERFVDPFNAWQEITMYMGGVLGTPSRPMYQLNDVEKRDKAGFDKWSFKKRAAG